jgi:hypothetical protein
MNSQYNTLIIVCIAILLFITGTYEGYLLYCNDIIKLNIYIFYFILIKSILNLFCSVNIICSLSDNKFISNYIIFSSCINNVIGYLSISLYIICNSFCNIILVEMIISLLLTCLLIVSIGYFIYTKYYINEDNNDYIILYPFT